MKILAWHGDSFLLGENVVDKKTALARVYDRRLNLLFPFKPLQSILARGYWRDFKGSRKERDAILAESEEAELRL